MRIKKSELLSMFERYKRAVEKFPNDYTKLRLCYAGCYGGWRVVDIGEGGCENHRFVHERMSTREMYYALLMAANTLENSYYYSQNNKENE